MCEKVIVIGSNSFSGSHFVDGALKEGLKDIGISRSQEAKTVFLPYQWDNPNIDKFSFYQKDLNHDLNQIMEIINDFKPEYIVNFAAQGMVAESWHAPEQWLLTNTISAINLHHQLKNSRFLKKFVQVSTPEVYGSCEGSVKESIRYDPSTPYAVSKAAVDMSLMTFFRQYNFPVVFTRSANVYGPGQQLYRVIPKAAISFKVGNQFKLQGGGRSVRAFIHIKDVVQGTLKAMSLGKPGSIFHFSTTDSLSIRTLVKIIAKKMSVIFEECVLDVDDRPGKDKAYLLNCSLALREFDWKTQVGLDYGIGETINWIKDNFDVLKNEPFDYIHTQ